MMSTLALLVTPQHLSCYRQEGGKWLPAPLEGEASSSLSEGAGRQVDAICHELHDAASIAAARLCLLVDDAPGARAHAAGLLTVALGAGIGRVDTWRLAPLATRAQGIAPGSPEQLQWCLDVLLPALDSEHRQNVRDEGAEAALHAELDAARRDNRDLAERMVVLQSRLDRQGATHREELAGLRARAAAMEPPPVDTLVRFMPLFFRHFWEKISPADMAHVLRVPELPAIASPFPEPGGAALAAMRRQFLGLPDPVRQAILALARDLAVNWDIRPDMLDLLREA